MPASRAPAMTSRTDNELWERARAGDEAAFETLYRRHARAIYNYLFRRLADWSEAEDLTAVVFLEAYRRHTDATVGDGKFLAWLYGIATNVLRNRRRTLWRHRSALRELRAAAGGIPAGPSERAAAAAELKRVLSLVRRLPREQQDVLALCVWSELSYAEAAAALGVPVGTVRSRLSRARRALRELSGDDGHEGGVVRESHERVAEL